MNEIEFVLRGNREWSRYMTEKEPDFFQKLARQQAPDFLWIHVDNPSQVPPPFRFIKAGNGLLEGAK
jgi:carbonic anhydrase